MAKTVIALVVVAFLIFFVSQSPDAAAHIVHNGWKVVDDSAHGIENFVNKVSS